MKTPTHILCALGIAALALFGPAPLAGVPSFVAPAAAQELMASGGDCRAVGQRYASQVGGQLARASAETRGGRTVCVVVVLMPARDGNHPQRDQVELPLN